MTAIPSKTIAPSPKELPGGVGVRVWLALAAILVLAAAVRIGGLTLNSFWIDEFYMLEYSAGNCHGEFALPRGEVLDAPPHLTALAGAPPVTGVWSSLREDQHPPLYYVMLRLWRDAFGSSDAAVRSLSVVASLVGILLLFDLARLLVGPVPALWACLIMALSLPQIWFAQEARSYAILTAALLGACAALVRIERLGFSPWRAVALAAWLLATMLTHYLGAAGCLAIGVYAVFVLRGAARTRTLAVMAASAVVYAAIWGPFLWQQLHGYAYQSTWLVDDAPGFVGRWADRLLTAPYRVLFRPVPDVAVLPWLVGLLLLLPLVARRTRPALLLSSLCAIALIAFPASLDLARHTKQLHFERYFIAAGPFIGLLAAGLPAVRRFRALPHVLPTSAVLFCLVSLPWAYVPHNLDWRSLAAAVARSVRPGDVIVYHTPAFGDWYSGVLYLDIDHYAPEHGARVLLLDGPPSPDVVAALHAAPNAWLVTDVTGFDVPRVLPGFAPGESEFTWGIGFLVKLVPTASPPPAETRTSSTPTTRGT